MYKEWLDRDPNRRKTADINIKILERNEEDVSRILTRDTLHLPVESQQSSSDPDTLSGTQAERLVRRLRGASRVFKYASVFLVVLCLSIGILYTTYQTMDRTTVPAVAVPNEPAVFNVSVSDPLMSDEPFQAVSKPEPVQRENVRAFNAAAQAERTVINIGERPFTYVSEPRSATDTSYINIQKDYSTNDGAQSLVGKAGIRPVPDENGRFTSSLGIQSQGNWEINNPQANIERGNQYMDYLNRTFQKNMKDSLVAQDVGIAKTPSALKNIKDNAQIPIMRYSE